MSRSFRTEKESVAAARRIERTEDGGVILPRIVERRPKPGDSHPLPKRALQALLQKIPVEYLYGLKRIELRARWDGMEFLACYVPQQREIRLYSLPMTM